MSKEICELPTDPQDLERLLIERQWQGDVDGMVALYEEGAVIDDGRGNLIKGHDEIRKLFETTIRAGEKFTRGNQSPALINKDIALTSTKLPEGSVTAEVARRQADGTWLWVVDKYSVT